jgi:hypothetical protein
LKLAPRNFLFFESDIDDLLDQGQSAPL